MGSKTCVPMERSRSLCNTRSYRRWSVLQDLDYTIYAAASFKRYEESTYGRNSLDVYHLMMSGVLKFENNHSSQKVKKGAGNKAAVGAAKNN